MNLTGGGHKSKIIQRNLIVNRLQNGKRISQLLSQPGMKKKSSIKTLKK
jgi:hypothetical protein